ncbi:MAG: hypothetical protein H6672_16615 [Anaerolineaceae bacterium]|nr:hypothetical protein [Anaerolineaceae bacterium]
MGALVTALKINLLNAARDMFDDLDPYAQIRGEVSSISKRGDALHGHAKDPITSGLSLHRRQMTPEIIPREQVTDQQPVHLTTQHHQSSRAASIGGQDVNTTNPFVRDNHIRLTLLAKL